MQTASAPGPRTAPKLDVADSLVSHHTYDYAIVGGGIVGLSVAWALLEKNPATRLVLLEKEADWAQHQTGRNSGVIHSGIYYKPGSLKARLCREGGRRMVEFCQQHGIGYEICGKVIVATESSELPRMEALYQRGLENGLVVKKLTREQVQEVEPHVRCLSGLHVPATGIVDYGQVCQKLAELIQSRGGELRLSTRVVGIRFAGGQAVVETDRGEFETRRLVNCAGLHSDRVAKLAGAKPEAQIVPFRGEYYELKPERRGLVKNLVYPVPDPEFPFLGVHFTRMIDGSVHAGPNAVLSLKREGYHRTAFSLRDSVATVSFPGFWRLVARHGKEGMKELYRSFSKAAFVRSLQRLVPEVQAQDLVPSEAGVRAQALRRDGGLVDDFLIVTQGQTVHICNAPSPAATASLEIGREIVGRLSPNEG
jgi:L-2-hydroxyglutarate oxidase